METMGDNGQEYLAPDLFDEKGNLKEDYASGECYLEEGETAEEVCNKTKQNLEELKTEVFTNQEADWYDDTGFSSDNETYIVQREDKAEDAAGIVLEMMDRNGISKELIEKIRYSNTIAEIGNIQINKGDLITIEQQDKNSYQINIGNNSVYVINKYNGEMYKIQ